MRTYERALITGATSGIGAAFAEALPATTHLLLTGRDPQRLANQAERLEQPDRSVETQVADLADPLAVEMLIQAADDFGIDLLINNAGLGPVGAVIDNPPELERETLMVNVVAVATLTRRLLPGMLQRARQRQRRAGLIIVASTAAFAPVPFFATYAASKAFDLNYTEALAEELRGEPIDVLALCPGPTRTGFAGRSGGRHGFDVNGIPGAADPASVAHEGLAALGRQTVRVSGTLQQAAFGPAVLPRRVITGVLGAAMRLIGARQR
jgi:short-subunit dehydrogenase